MPLSLMLSELRRVAYLVALLAVPVCGCGAAQRGSGAEWEEGRPPRREERSGLGGTAARSGGAGSTAGRGGIACASSESCIEEAIRAFGNDEYVRAAEAARRGLATYPERGDSERRHHVEEMLAQCRTQIGILRVRVTPVGAEVRVNERLLRAEEDREEVFVEAGEVKVEAAARGYESASRTVKVEKGGAVEVALAMKATAAGGPLASATAPATGTATAAPPAPAATGGPSVPVLVTGIGLTAASLGVGLGLLVAGSVKKGDADRVQQSLLDRGIVGLCDTDKTDPGCNELTDLAGTAQVMTNTGGAFLIGAGVAGIFTAVYAVVNRSHQDKPVAPRVTFAVSPDGVGMSVGGNF